MTRVPTARFDPRRRLAAVPVYYGWIVVGACFVVGLITWGTIWSFGVFFGHIVSEFGLSHANTSIVFSLQTAVTFGAAAVLGFVIDRYGARWLLLVAAGLVVAGLLGVSRLPTFLGVALAYGVVAASGFGIATVISYVTPVRWFERRRGFAVGIATAGAGVGVLVVPPVAELLIARVGWRAAYAGLTGGFLVILALGAVVLADRPEDLDLDPATEFSNGNPRDALAGDWRAQVRDVARVARSPAFVTVFLAYVCLSAPMIVLLVNAVEYTTNLGIGRGLGVLAISVLGTMNVAGKFVGGAVIDRVGEAPTVAASGAFEAVGLAVLVLVPHPLAVIGAAVIFGFGWGIWIGFLAPLLADFFGTLSINALFGLAAIAFGVSGSIAPYLAGLAFDAFGTFVPVFAVAAVIAAAGGGLVLAADRLAPPPPADA